MDLIYADETRKDIDVLPPHKLDMAYGKDENNFSVSVDRDAHCCGAGYLIYAENTDYGGIVDAIAVDSERCEITYSGRTWHGILEGKVICPDPGDDYYVVSGEANTVLQMIIDHIGLSGMFIASTADSGVQIRNYQFERYCKGYTGIRKMLREYGLKVKLSWRINMVRMSAELVRDYSQDEEFDTSQVDFKVSKNYRPVNHLVCLGQGNLRDRAVIHIYTDDHGGIQPYLVDPSKDPVEDSDYILDTSQQVLFDQDEVMDLYDMPSAEITTNYVLLTEEPADWEENCTAYYVQEANTSVVDGATVSTGSQYSPVKAEGSYEVQTSQPADWSTNYGRYYTYDMLTGAYKAVTGTISYGALTAQPTDWETAFGRYFSKDGTEYVAVEGVVTTEYVRQAKQPADWSTNYGAYYERDGSAYNAVQSESHYVYDLQTQQPADWASGYGSYFRRATSRELDTEDAVQYYAVTLDQKGRVPAWKSNTYYTRTLLQDAPVWSSNIYTRIDTTAAPAWSSGAYYQQTSSSGPEWEANTYYTSTGAMAAPAWAAGTYFRQAIDRYKVMVEGAIDKINDEYAADDLDINLEETDRTYDVGDIVGARDEITGQGAVQEVTKKIITIENDDINIRYEVD